MTSFDWNDFEGGPDYLDGADLTDYCGMQADMCCDVCMTCGDCVCEPVIVPVVPVLIEDVPF